MTLLHQLLSLGQRARRRDHNRRRAHPVCNTILTHSAPPQRNTSLASQRPSEQKETTTYRKSLITTGVQNVTIREVIATGGAASAGMLEIDVKICSGRYRHEKASCAHSARRLGVQPPNRVAYLPPARPHRSHADPAAGGRAARQGSFRHHSA